jgi:hypothetical protein
MKTKIICLHSAGINDEESIKSRKTSKLVKFVLVTFMLIWMTIMSSCAAIVPPRGPLGYHHGGYGHACFRSGCCGFGGWGYHRYYGGYH